MQCKPESILGIMVHKRRYMASLMQPAIVQQRVSERQVLQAVSNYSSNMIMTASGNCSAAAARWGDASFAVIHVGSPLAS